MKKQVGERIRIQRNIKGLSQESVALELNLSNGAYSNIERGKTDVSIERLYQIANYFDISIYELIPPNKPLYTIKQTDSNNITEALIAKVDWLTEQVNRINSNTPKTYRSLKSKKR